MVTPSKGFVQIDGFGRVLKRLEVMSLKGKVKATAQVGYRKHYSVYVHENLQSYHAPPTQAKFLESPARRLESFLSAMIAAQVASKKSVESAVMKAAEYLLAESQKIVPVDTGALQKSGFAELK